MALSLNDVVQVDVQISPVTSVTTNFNMGCIFSESSTANAGCNYYTKSNYNTKMQEDDFDPTNDASVFAMATAYFAQSSNPDRLCIYVKTEDDTDELDMFKAALATSGAYAFFFPEILTDESTAAQIKLLTDALAYSEASEIPNVVFYGTAQSGCITAAGGVFKTAKDNNWGKAFGVYISATEAEDTPSMELAPVCAMGYFCGLNTLLANSAYTIAYKNLAATAPIENLTETQLNYLVENRGNGFLRFEDSYNFLYSGLMANGLHLDERYFIDVVKTLIKQSVVNTLISNKKIPQTESGVNIITNTISAVCNRLLNVGFIGSGIWKGNSIGNLNSGDAIENGFYVYSESIASQTAEERASRVSPPIYVALLSSGAIEHVVIAVTIER